MCAPILLFLGSCKEAVAIDVALVTMFSESKWSHDALLRCLFFIIFFFTRVRT